MIDSHQESRVPDTVSPVNKLTYLLEKAVQCHENGMTEDAITYCQRVLKQTPDRPDALQLLGVLENESGNYDQAVLLISRAIQSVPSQPALYSNLGNAFRGLGDIQKAITCYQKSLTLDPEFKAAYYNLAVAYRQDGLVDDAETVLKKALERNPKWFDAWCLLGDLLNNQMRTDESIACFEKSLEVNPHFEKAWFFMGNAFRSKNDFQKAESCYRSALAIKSDFIECLNNLGLICTKTDKLVEAVECYEKALRHQPDFAEVHYNLGNALCGLGRENAAISCYQTAIHFKPDFFEPMVSLGKVYHAYGDYSQALQRYNQALELKPRNWQVIEQVGNVKRFAGDTDGALECYQRALKINPVAHTVFISIGNTHRQLNESERAVSAYRNALKHKPESLTALNNLAIALTDIGKSEEAVSIFYTMLAIRDDFSTHIKKAMTLPIIYPSANAMLNAREAFSSAIERLGRTGDFLADPYHDIGIANFILALHGVDEKPIRELIARFYLRICPQLAWSSPGLDKKKRSKRIKLGMVCRYLHNHTIGRLYRGLIEKLDKTRFDLFIFRFDRQEDAISCSIDRCAQEVVYLPKDIYKARERIGDAELDILFYPEIGMDPLTYFIAFSRLAPVQCKRGFQITMGIPTIDYFISSDAAEPPEAQQHYSEDLVRLKGTGYYYPRPKKPDVLPARSSFSLPENKKLYLCTQSLFKLHPDFDAVLAAVLEKDPQGALVLVEGMQPHWKTLLMKRFKETIPNVCDRITFVPRQPRKDFLNLHRLADAVLDTIYFSGGHTSLECFAWGIPVVAWPSALLPGRLTYGFYKQMGLMECVAWEQSGYVEIAFRLANDVDWRNEISRKILERSTVLFENTKDVKELEHFFQKAVNEAYCEKR